MAAAGICTVVAMESLDPVAQVRELWRAWAGGGVEALLAHVDDDAEWAPHAEGRVLRGAEELRAFWADVAARGERREATLYRLERHGDAVVASGALRVVRDGHLTESQLAWVHAFVGGRLRSTAAYDTRAEALRAAASAVAVA